VSVNTKSARARSHSAVRFIRALYKEEFRGRVLKGEGEDDLENFLLPLPLNPCFPLSYEYNARFNGIRLPSVERVDLTLKVETGLVESGESPPFLSIETKDRRQLSLDSCPRRSLHKQYLMSCI